MIKTLLFLILIFIVSCATNNENHYYKMEILLENSQYADSSKYLKNLYPSIDKSERFHLLLSQSISAYYEGDYKKAISYFERVKNINQAFKDSLSQKVISGLYSAEYARYQLSECEEKYVSYFIILSYLALGDYDNAASESRYIINHLKNYNHYILGLAFELSKNYQDAYLEYKFDINSVQTNKNSYIPFYLIGKKIGLVRQAEDFLYKKNIQFDYMKNLEYKCIKDNKIIIYNIGLAPFKIENKNYTNVPVYQYRNYEYEEILLKNENLIFTDLIDIQGELKNELNSHYKEMVMNDLIKIGTQEALLLPLDILSAGGLGLINRAIIHHNYNEDFRSWRGLPAKIKIVRFNQKESDIVINHYDNEVIKNNNNIFIIRSHNK